MLCMLDLGTLRVDLFLFNILVCYVLVRTHGLLKWRFFKCKLENENTSAINGLRSHAKNTERRPDTRKEGHAANFIWSFGVPSCLCKKRDDWREASFEYGVQPHHLSMICVAWNCLTGTFSNLAKRLSRCGQQALDLDRCQVTRQSDQTQKSTRKHSTQKSWWITNPAPRLSFLHW